MCFPTKYQDIIARIQNIDPADYGRTRNFMDGAVTRLSPYISRGVISTRMVMDHVLKLGYPLYKVEKFIQELAWRDYWQQVWIAKGDLINEDLKYPQVDVCHQEMPCSLLDATTGINAIDQSLKQFLATGYMHNHMRMYVASLACNIGKSHWKTPARWMYYHLLDGDWASNALSWQWVAGSNANKKYYANQENINKYWYTSQCGSFLDIPYDEFSRLSIPTELSEITSPEWITPLPDKKVLNVDSALPILIYNYYNLDPMWRKEEPANRVLLVEPCIFEQYPISGNVVRFMLELAQNIKGIQVYSGGFDELLQETGISEIIFKEHPLNRHYKGIEDSRDWMFSVSGYYPSFFAFWKKCKKELVRRYR